MEIEIVRLTHHYRMQGRWLSIFARWRQADISIGLRCSFCSAVFISKCWHWFIVSRRFHAR